MPRVLYLAVIPALWLAGCATLPAPGGNRASALASAVPWPAADALFHQDPRWLGADDAYTVDLGRGRVLWLFADTFIATSPAHVRRESTMIRNSVAIERGYDLSQAAMKFYWNESGGKPGSFFPEDGQSWYWPGGGVRVGHALLLFLMKERQASSGLFGFVAGGWSAVLVENPGDEPSAWRMRQLDCPQNNFGVIVGSGGVLRDGGYVYAFGSREPAVHDIFLVRWTAAAAEQGDLQAPEWWDAAKSAWVAQRDLPPKPQPVFTNGATEFSVHYDARLRQFIEIQSDGFAASHIAVRSAPALTGPWSALQDFYRPSENDIPGVFSYAAKAHPELQDGSGALILTYATNSIDLSTQVENAGLYYPRVLRAKLTEGPFAR
jgi:hypothetical protein